MAKAKLYRFHLDIGDWSDDGHGKKETFLIESNKTVGACREAYFKAQKKLAERLWPSELSAHYEERFMLSDSRVAEIRKLGFNFGAVVLGDEYEYANAVGMAHYTLWFIKHGNPRINARIVPLDTFAFYGSDKKGRHIGFIGYGCFT